MDESIDRPESLTGDGLCEELAPDVFVLLDDGLAYAREGLPNTGWKKP